jgi:hypothetical protein
MGLLGKKKGEGKESPTPQKEATKPLDKAEAVINNLESPKSNPEKALLDKYAAGIPSAQAASGSPAPQSDASKPAEQPAQAQPSRGGDDVSKDLLDIFKSEDIDTSELSALTKDLQEVDGKSLLTQAQTVANRLRSAVKS